VAVLRAGLVLSGSRYNPRVSSPPGS
jgi:hypothetical protein